MAQTYQERYIPQNSITPGEVIRTTLLNRISWGAVFAGVAMGFATHVILNMIGVGTGILVLEFAEPASNSQTQTLSFAASVWWIASGIVSAGVGGLTAGRLSGEPKASTAGWHGLISWAASILLLTLVMTTAAGALTANPYQLVVSNNNMTVAPDQPATSEEPLNSINPSAPGDTTANTAGDTTGNVSTQQISVDRETASAAALTSAFALILGALAAWYFGRAGAVSADKQENLAQ